LYHIVLVYIHDITIYFWIIRYNDYLLWCERYDIIIFFLIIYHWFYIILLDFLHWRCSHEPNFTVFFSDRIKSKKRYLRRSLLTRPYSPNRVCINLVPRLPVGCLRGPSEWSFSLEKVFANIILYFFDFDVYTNVHYTPAERFVTDHSCILYNRYTTFTLTRTFVINNNNRRRSDIIYFII